MPSAKVTPTDKPFETLVLQDVTRDEADGISFEATPQTWQVIDSMGGPQEPPRGADARDGQCSRTCVVKRAHHPCPAWTCRVCRWCSR